MAQVPKEALKEEPNLRALLIAHKEQIKLVARAREVLIEAEREERDIANEIERRKQAGER